MEAPEYLDLDEIDFSDDISDNSYQGNRIQRHGLGARDREDTLSFGSGRAKMTVVVAQRVVGRCPGNEYSVTSLKTIPELCRRCDSQSEDRSEWSVGVCPLDGENRSHCRAELF
uniref:Synuclein alpha interacting protein n=1 Tax=Neovison vison TaxID=452646 RepID=A0A8C7BXA3_NEOVI